MYSVRERTAFAIPIPFGRACALAGRRCEARIFPFIGARDPKMRSRPSGAFAKAWLGRAGVCTCRVAAVRTIHSLCSILTLTYVGWQTVEVLAGERTQRLVCERFKASPEREGV